MNAERSEKHHSQCISQHIVLNGRQDVVLSEVKVSVICVVLRAYIFGGENYKMQSLTPKSHHYRRVLILNKLRDKHSLRKENHPIGDLGVEQLELGDVGKVKRIVIHMIEHV